VIDLRTIKPIDLDLILESAKKTGRVVVADGGWKTSGFAAEVSASISEGIFSFLKSPVKRVTLPDIPAPASRTLENAYYPNSNNIVDAVIAMLQHN